MGPLSRFCDCVRRSPEKPTIRDTASRRLSAVSNLEDVFGAHDIPFEAFDIPLSAALADGLAEGRPPPARLIDIAAVCSLSELRPRAMTARDWLAELDPDASIAAQPGGERNALIRRSAAWHHDRPIMAHGWRARRCWTTP